MIINHKAIVRERRIKLFFFLMAIIFLLAFVLLVKNLLVSFLLAFVTYYLLAPAVNFWERQGLSRTWATLLPFIGLTGVLVLAAQMLLPALTDQLSSLHQDLPKYMDVATRFLSRMEGQLNTVVAKVYPIDIKGKIEPRLIGMATHIFENLPSYLSQSLTVFFLTPFLAFFMLLDGRKFIRQMLELVPNNVFELALNLTHQINAQMGGFIRARLLESALVGTVIYIGLFCLDFPYALVLAVFAGIINIIPYLGPFIGIAPALIINFANSGSQTELFWLLFIYALAQILDIVLIVPFVVAKIVDLHPVTVVLAVIVGSQAMGILGMVISIPLFSALKVVSIAIYKHLTDFRS